ncbi:MAG: prepilin-type N-terminal cleavage/methylation domain-containing protein [Candidatus Omnitrophica bacterium]|nr:prepilin-type N-terminal cleavage/methylation domain-containing protein [Candidatus Omnitrophica bacterium COP1]MCL4734625.1 prepilin-type N-terminal cleavage/methylation domain-containing protein [Candidatus Omnitrophota bacterium]NUP92296.1 prepilin-type N-terminal cleavage/methylation domain-containing protein [Candidatus Omnitrophota bacterium]
MKKSGFTLIELLIVIAIILILIAIALPNFLEAQIRAKVTNAMAEMRSIEPAIASYLQDWKRYPRDGFELPAFPGTYPEENPRIWVQLTTPIKYFGRIPYDEFHVANKDTQGNQRSEKNQTYRYYGAWWRCLAIGGNPKKNSETCSKPEAERDFVGKWVIFSPGPDQIHNYGEWSMYRPYLRTAPYLYSPTNGTTSIGDLVKWGS